MSGQTASTLWFKDIGIGDRPSVGGKGASLGEMTKAGIPVPPGFVVTTAAFEEFLTVIDPKGGIRQSIEEVEAENLDALGALAKDIRHKIESAPLPEHLYEELEAAYDKLGQSQENAPVAIRSSATSEDSAEASFAGLQDTYLWVRGADQVIHYVRSCWASLYATESVSYRRRLKLPEAGLAMGVVVQAMVDSRSSGVMFTRSPTTGDRSVISIEGSWGLGSSIVSGEVTPDKFVVNKVTGEISDRAIAAKAVEHLPDADIGGVKEEEVPADRQSVPCLSDEEIAELAAIGKRVEKHYGSAQDIEWAIPREGTGDGIYLLQSRPETVWSGREAKPVAKPKAKAMDHVFALMSGKK